MKGHSYDSYEVKDEDIKRLLNDIGHIVKTAISRSKENYGFAFFIFSFGEGGNFFYISDAQRDDMIKLLDEFKEKLNDSK